MGPQTAVVLSSVAGATIDENFFDWNGGITGNYFSPNLFNSPMNVLGHDIYCMSDSYEHAVSQVSIRNNLFARTLMSIKGPSMGSVLNNLFYNPSSVGYIGPWGSFFSYNVVMNGSGVLVSTDNSCYGNTSNSSINEVSHNLNYIEPSYYNAQTIGTGVDGARVGAFVIFWNNVIDGYGKGINLADPYCFNYSIEQNTIQATNLYGFQPLACSISAAANQYYSSVGSSNTVFYDNTTWMKGFAALENVLLETNGKFGATAFKDPTRNISSYLKCLMANGVIPKSSKLMVGDYLALIQNQATQIHAWNPNLAVGPINNHLRRGHNLASYSLNFEGSETEPQICDL